MEPPKQEQVKSNFLQSLLVQEIVAAIKQALAEHTPPIAATNGATLALSLRADYRRGN